MFSVPSVDPDIMMSSNEVTLNSHNISECVSMIFNGTRECTESERNLTIMARWRESMENSVIFSRQEATIIITTKMSKCVNVHES